MQGNGPAGRRERKKNRTRTDLIEAATALFATRGFDETTTDDIAEAADVSQRTFFRHFASKEAVLYGDTDELLVRLRRALDGRPGDEAPWVAVRAAVLALADGYDDQRKLRLLQARLAASYPSVSAYSRAVVAHAWQQAIAEGVAGRMGVDSARDPLPEIIAAAAVAALGHATARWVRSRGRSNLPKLAADALDAAPLLGAGILAEP